MSSAFRAVLFDWRGTLFHDEDEADWIRASAASVGRSMTSSQMFALLEGLGSEVIAAHQTADCSADLHCAAVLLELRLAGFDDQLAHACHDRDGHLNALSAFNTVVRDQRAMLRGAGERMAVVVKRTDFQRDRHTAMVNGRWR
jgi:hypothetical protein